MNLTGLETWLSTHKKEAALGGAGVGVAALALRRAKANKTAAAAGGTTASANGTATGTSTPVGAGMDSTDLQNWVQGALNNQTSQIAAQYGTGGAVTSAGNNPPVIPAVPQPKPAANAGQANASSYAGAAGGINKVINNFASRGPTYAKQSQGASYVLGGLSPSNTAAQNVAMAAAKVKYLKASGASAAELEGAQQAAAWAGGVQTSIKK